MISRDIASKVLSRCLITGGDFAEIFEEDSVTNTMGLIDNKVENALGGRTYGIGIRIFKGFKSGGLMSVCGHKFFIRLGKKMGVFLVFEINKAPCFSRFIIGVTRFKGVKLRMNFIKAFAVFGNGFHKFSSLNQAVQIVDRISEIVADRIAHNAGNKTGNKHGIVIERRCHSRHKGR